MVAGRRARPMATACAQDPRDKANTEARGTLGSKSRGSTLGQGRHINFVIFLLITDVHQKALSVSVANFRIDIFVGS